MKYAKKINNACSAGYKAPSGTSNSKTKAFKRTIKKKNKMLGNPQQRVFKRIRNPWCRKGSKNVRSHVVPGCLFFPPPFSSSNRVHHLLFFFLTFDVVVADIVAKKTYNFYIAFSQRFS